MHFVQFILCFHFFTMIVAPCLFSYFPAPMPKCPWSDSHTSSDFGLHVSDTNIASHLHLCTSLNISSILSLELNDLVFFWRTVNMTSLMFSLLSFGRWPMLLPLVLRNPSPFSLSSFFLSVIFMHVGTSSSTCLSLRPLPPVLHFLFCSFCCWTVLLTSSSRLLLVVVSFICLNSVLLLAVALLRFRHAGRSPAICLRPRLPPPLLLPYASFSFALPSVISLWLLVVMTALLLSIPFDRLLTVEATIFFFRVILPSIFALLLLCCGMGCSSILHFHKFLTAVCPSTATIFFYDSKLDCGAVLGVCYKLWVSKIPSSYGEIFQWRPLQAISLFFFRSIRVSAFWQTLRICLFDHCLWIPGRHVWSG